MNVSLAFLSGHLSRGFSTLSYFCLALRNSETSKVTSPACLLPFSEKMRTVNLVYLCQGYFFLVEFLTTSVEIHVALQFQGFVEGDHAFIDLPPFFNLRYFITWVIEGSPLRHETETTQGNLSASVTVWMYAVKANL